MWRFLFYYFFIRIYLYFITAQYNVRMSTEGIKVQGSPVEICDRFITMAVVGNASDIHIDAYEKYVYVRMRVDGELKRICEYGIESHGQLIRRIKILAGMRSDDSFHPHDGRISWSSGDLSAEIRVVVTPAHFGEAVTMRFLGKIHVDVQTYTAIQHEHIQKIVQTIRSKQGALLVVGPTGSGKTTTLYTLLQSITDNTKQVITLEDPIEYICDSVRQIQITPNKNFSFADGLRSVLRQDPNIVLLGEMRDQETAQVAMSAALTGHILLSTLHTQTAIHAIARLKDMGIPSFMIGAGVSVIIAQRLVKKLCVCKKKTDIELYQLEFLDKQSVDITKLDGVYVAVGCSTCKYTGYKGRVLVYEMLFIDNAIKKCIHEDIYEIQKIWLAQGGRTIAECGLDMVRAGEITVEQLMHIAYEK